MPSKPTSEAQHRPELQRRGVAAAILLVLAGACLDNAMSPPFGFLVIPPDTLPQGLRPIVNVQCPGYKHYDVRPLTLWLRSDAPVADTVQVTVLGRKATDTTTCSVTSDRFGLSPLQPVLDTAFFSTDSTVQIALHAGADARSALSLAQNGQPFRTVTIQMASRQFATLAIGHRGAGWRWPENTLMGLRAASRAGLRASEVDVRLSFDTIPVLMHDSTVDRTTDGSGFVAQLPASYITSLNAGARFGAAFSGERVPTLTAALAATDSPRLPLQLDVIWQKRFSPDFEANLIVSLVRQAGAEDRVSLLSPDTAFLKAARALSPSIGLTLLPDVFIPWQGEFCVQAGINAVEYRPEFLADPNHWSAYFAMLAAGVQVVASTTNSPVYADSLLHHLPLAGITTDLPPTVYQGSRTADPLALP